MSLLLAVDSALRGTSAVILWSVIRWSDGRLARPAVRQHCRGRAGTPGAPLAISGQPSRQSCGHGTPKRVSVGLAARQRL